jgi:hypothetical protein
MTLPHIGGVLKHHTTEPPLTRVSADYDDDDSPDQRSSELRKTDACLLSTSSMLSGVRCLKLAPRYARVPQRNICLSSDDASPPLLRGCRLDLLDSAIYSRCIALASVTEASHGTSGIIKS